jgi:hypothetical protein
MANKTRNNFKIQLKLDDPKGQIEMVVKKLYLKKETHLKERFLVKFPFTEVKNGKKIISIIILGNGKEIERKSVKFLGPIF